MNKKIAYFLIVVVISGFAIKNVTSCQKNTAATNSVSVKSPCDASKWNHIYHSFRLEVKDDCKTVTGTIEVIRKEKDGDEHLLLRLDAGQESLLNDKNNSGQHGCLVLEPICVGKVTQTDAIDDCKDYINDVSIPAAGSHVSVMGSYVLDKDHGWMEIHPVTSIILK